MSNLAVKRILANHHDKVVLQCSALKVSMEF